MTTSRLHWIVLPLAAALFVAAAARPLPGVGASETAPPGPAAALFFGRLQAALTAVSETPLRIQVDGQTVLFESPERPTRAGNMAFAGRFILDPSGRAFEGALERFSLSGGRIELNLKAPARLRCAPDGTLSIEGFGADGPQGRISAEASITREGKYDALLRLAGADLNAFSPLLAPSSMGTLDAELELRGDWESLLSDAGPTMEVRLRGGRLRPESGIPVMESLDGKAGLVGSRLEIRSVEGLAGGAPFRVAGRVENPVSLSENGWVDLSLTGDNLLLYRSEEVRVRAAADLRLAGPFASLALSGTLAITEGRCEKNFDPLPWVRGAGQKGSASRLELFSIRPPPLRDAVLDVIVTASKPFEIKNSRVRAAARPELRLTGTGGKPILTGSVFFDPGTLYLPGGRLQFESGAVRFQPPDPGRPWLELSGHGRLQGYDVSAVVEGPYDQPTVTLSSSPALPNEELLLLVLSGQPPKPRRALDSERSRNLDVAFFLGKDMISRIEGPRSDETTESIMERFNVEVGRNSARSGDDTVRVLFRMADGVFREGDTLSLAGEKDAYGYYNGGVRIAFRFR
jgi:translocation and assembly module TamB